MSAMQAFYNSLSSAPESAAPYLGALRGLMKATLSQLKAAAGDLGWQIW